jgi:hypothetical protein
MGRLKAANAELVFVSSNGGEQRRVEALSILASSSRSSAHR